ncbi:META domain-containing protein [Robiginitomaculum antarcticum]|uniref:META domain-containing protein n=1 Tax=Robiginitomaculum antarcticum TaxID=437507 RepID=UPI00035F4837|nr:YbaY family lipoprotein [Robiginitomaculum antarcticum]
MIKSLTAISALTLTTVLSACAAPQTDTPWPRPEATIMTTQITGQVGYRERIALRPGGSVAVTLEDVSIMDPASKVLARDDISIGGQQVPIAFTLNVDPSALKPRGRYSVRAKIFDRDGNLEWITDTAYLIKTNGEDQDMGLLQLVKVDDGADNTVPYSTHYLCGTQTVHATFTGENLALDMGGHSYNLTRTISASGAKYSLNSPDHKVLFWSKGDSAFMEMNDEAQVSCMEISDTENAPLQIDLTGREWVVEDIANTGIIDSSRMTLNFDANGRLSGLSGCNNYTTEFSRDGMNLTAGNIALTRRACAPALMNQEQKFLDVLSGVQSFYHDGTGALILKTADGRQILAR